MAKYSISELSYDDIMNLFEDDELLDNVWDDVLDIAQNILIDTVLIRPMFNVTYDNGTTIRNIVINPDYRDKLSEWFNNDFKEFNSWSGVVDDDEYDDIADEVERITEDPNYSMNSLEYLLSLLDRYLPQDIDDVANWLMSSIYDNYVIDTDTKTIEPEE